MNTLTKSLLLTLLFLQLLNPVFALPQFKPEEGIYIYEVNSGDVITSQNENQQFIPASTTKLMTAIILINMVDDLNEKVVVGDEVNDYTWADSQADLFQGQELSYYDLLNAMLIPSGNDAAGTIAVNLGRKLAGNPSLDKASAQNFFINKMNQTAKEMGLTQTHFQNPHGTYTPNHYTTPKEMAKIATVAFENDTIREICSKKTYPLKFEDGSPNNLLSTNIFLYENNYDMAGSPVPQNAVVMSNEQVQALTASGVEQTTQQAIIVPNALKTDLIKAGKTGNTDEGGRTFTFYSEIGDAKIVGVIFKTDDMGIFSESKAVAEDLNGNYELKDITNNKKIFKNIEVDNVHFTQEPILEIKSLDKSYFYNKPDVIADLESEIRLDDQLFNTNGQTVSIVEPIKEDQKVGAAVIKNGDETYKTIPIYAAHDLNPKNFLDWIVENIYYIGIGLIVLVLLFVLINRSLKKRKSKTKVFVSD